MSPKTWEVPTVAPNIRFYIVRGGVMVPLVPVDQLPYQIQGTPRQLTHQQMSDEGWKFLKSTEEPKTNLAMQNPGNMLPNEVATPKIEFRAPDHRVRYRESKPEVEPSQHVTPPGTPIFIKDRESGRAATHQTGSPRVSSTPEPASPMADSITSTCKRDAYRIDYRKPNPSGIEPDASKKEYCTHWIKTGDCAFVSVGCKYKHEMPTMDKLRELGFTRMPLWWKEKTAITARGPTWLQRQLQNAANGEKDAKTAASLRADPDQPGLRSKLAKDCIPSTKCSSHKRMSPETPTNGSSTSKCAIPSKSKSAPRTQQRYMTGLLIDLDDVPEQLSALQKSKHAVIRPVSPATSCSSTATSSLGLSRTSSIGSVTMHLPPALEVCETKLPAQV